MQSSMGYILRTRPYTEASVIVDLFTKDAGRMTCITRPAKLRGKVQKGHLQAFRLLQLHWQGRSDLSRLTQTDERFRHRIPAKNLLFGLYLNELLLKLVQTHSPQEAVFTIYQHSLQLLCDSELPMVVVMQFELALVNVLGHMPDLWQEDGQGEAIVAGTAYAYGLNVGLYTKSSMDYAPADHSRGAVPVSGYLLIALRQPETMDLENYQELRSFLDTLWMRIVRKPFNSRKLLRF